MQFPRSDSIKDVNFDEMNINDFYRYYSVGTPSKEFNISKNNVKSVNNIVQNFYPYIDKDKSNR